MQAGNRRSDSYSHQPSSAGSNELVTGRAETRSGKRDLVDEAQIQAALDDVFDQAIVFHAYTDYMRDYEIITYSGADARTSPLPTRYLFRFCVEAEMITALRPDIWARSLDERLIDPEGGNHLDGYVWGVRWQRVYPGAKIVPNSERAKRWTDAVGLLFHEVSIETNGHNLTLVFADLQVTRAAPGYAPFLIDRDNHDGPQSPLQ